MENTSLRDPMRSETFTGPSAGDSGRIVGPTRPGLQHEFEKFHPGENSERDSRDSRIVTLDGPRAAPGNVGQARAASPRIISYRSITAAFHSALHSHHFALGSDKNL